MRKSWRDSFDGLIVAGGLFESDLSLDIGNLTRGIDAFHFLLRFPNVWSKNSQILTAIIELILINVVYL